MLGVKFIDLNSYIIKKKSLNQFIDDSTVKIWKKKSKIHQKEAKNKDMSRMTEIENNKKKSLYCRWHNRILRKYQRMYEKTPAITNNWI